VVVVVDFFPTSEQVFERGLHTPARTWRRRKWFFATLAIAFAAVAAASIYRTLAADYSGLTQDGVEAAMSRGLLFAVGWLGIGGTLAGFAMNCQTMETASALAHKADESAPSWS
jgi:hypothetical protein